jgi:hypothetical protein
MPIQFTQTLEPVAPPPTAPLRRNPRVRLYEGDWISSSFKIRENTKVINDGRGMTVTAENVINMSGATATAEVTMPVPPVVGDTYVAFVFWESATVTLTPPAGWSTLAGPVTGTGMRIAAYGRPIDATDTDEFTFTFSSAVAWGLTVAEYIGIITTSALDKTASNTGTGTAVSTGTTAATAQASEIAFAMFAHRPTAGRIGSSTLGPGYTQVHHPVSFGTTRMVTAQRSLIATGAQSMTATTTESGPWAALIFTMKGTAVRKFTPLGELDAVRGRATMRPQELGDIELEVSTIDPASRFIKKNTIIEVWIPGDLTDSPWTFGWFIVREVEEDDTRQVPYLIVRGPDLRGLIYDRPLGKAVFGTVRGAPPANTSAESWAREYVDKSCINIAATAYWGTADKVAGLVLETPNGERGTTYAAAGAPGKSGATLGETITQLYRRDNLGWRLIVVDAGTMNASIQFCTFAGIDRRLGVLGDAVFAEQFDTAHSVRYHHSAVGCITAAVVKGKQQANGTRVQHYVVDETAKQEWGLIVGEIDASTEEVLDANIAQQYLTERLPKKWITLESRETVALRLRNNYGLLDKVTALTRNGQRMDDTITEISIDITAGSEDSALGGFSGVSSRLPSAAGDLATVPAPLLHGIVPESPKVSIVVGHTHESAPDGGRDRKPAALRDYGTMNVEQAALADTSGATLSTLETEVNALKARLRAAEIIA